MKRKKNGQKPTYKGIPEGFTPPQVKEEPKEEKPTTRGQEVLRQQTTRFIKRT